jgi:hypothetical protein
LANRCVPDDELGPTVDEITAAIAANSWFTSRTDKFLVDAGEPLSLADGLAFERANSPGAGPETMARLGLG